MIATAARPLPSLAAVDLADRLVAYRTDPWLWIRECVWTVDEVDRASPIKRFPVAVCIRCDRYAGGDEVAYSGPDKYLGGVCPACAGALEELAYLRWLTRAWQAAGTRDGTYRSTPEGPPMIADHPPILAVPKPRRMRLSWLMVSLHTHLAVFTPNAKVFIVSSKLEKSAELIERADGLLRRIPGALHPIAPWAKTGSIKGGVPLLEFANGARLWGVAEGADQIRQYGATAILCDEIGTWLWARESYAALVPTIEGGGQLTMISSAYPGFWGELVEGGLTA